MVETSWDSARFRVELTRSYPDFFKQWGRQVSIPVFHTGPDGELVLVWGRGRALASDDAGRTWRPWPPITYNSNPDVAVGAGAEYGVTLAVYDLDFVRDQPAWTRQTIAPYIEGGLAAHWLALHATVEPEDGPDITDLRGQK